jgi:hypothetical protein
MSTYWLLFILPCVTAPVQSLLANAGRRFDLGCLHYIAISAFAVGLAISPKQGGHMPILLPLLSLTIVPVRVFVLSYMNPQAFTLVSLGQLWMTSSLIDYCLYAAQLSGVDTGGPRLSPPSAATISLVFALLLALALKRAKIPSKLTAATESPDQYDLTIGPRWRLALCVEGTCMLTYFVAGGLFALASYHLSTASFTNEAPWIVLPAMVTPLGGIVRVAIPAMLSTLARFASQQWIPANYSELIMYLCFAMALFVGWLRYGRGRDVARR